MIYRNKKTPLRRLLAAFMAAPLAWGFMVFSVPSILIGVGGGATVYAEDPPPAMSFKKSEPKNRCGGVSTFFKIPCGRAGGSGVGDNPFFRVLLWLINGLTLLVGLAAVGGVIAGGIVYSSAGDNAEQTKKGISYVVNSVIAVLLFAFMFAILNFVVPGGIFT